MEHEGDQSEEYSSNASSHSFSVQDANLRQGSSGTHKNAEHVLQMELEDMTNHASGSAASPPLPSVLTPEFQEMVICAILQSSASFPGSSAGVLHHVGQDTLGKLIVKKEAQVQGSTWTECSYWKFEAKKIRKPEFMRTSTGEDSNSEEDFPLRENATAEQRTLRNRRLNRWHRKRANDLISNRKALKKLPHVIHIDGTCKPKGIHRHLWKAAVRGQCSRLDPTMDNINHHSKQVVDSMWHALEAEWQFEGFAHKAREMFEKSATKCMQNRKMQLKYKCLKLETGKRPNDVSETYWKKIQQITKTSSKQVQRTTAAVTGASEKTTVAEAVENGRNDFLAIQCEQEQDKEVGCSERMNLACLKNAVEKVNSSGLAEKQGKSYGMLPRSSEFSPMTGDSSVSKTEDVDSQIKLLRRQLQWLENSRKSVEILSEELAEVAVKLTKGKGTRSEVFKASQIMKENVSPRKTPDDKKSPLYSKLAEKSPDKICEGDIDGASWKRMSMRNACTVEGRTSLEELLDLDTTKRMECGDIISVATVIEGKEEDIGKGILMGFAGSKFARKVIPQGWCSMKLTSCTAAGGAEACPFLSGWKDQVKERTIKDAHGCTILWPESLVHI